MRTFSFSRRELSVSALSRIIFALPNERNFDDGNFCSFGCGERDVTLALLAIQRAGYKLSPKLVNSGWAAKQLSINLLKHDELEHSWAGLMLERIADASHSGVEILCEELGAKIDFTGERRSYLW